MSQYSYLWAGEPGAPDLEIGDDIYVFNENGTNVARLKIMPEDEQPIDGVYWRAMHMNVHQDHRRLGIGTRMYEMALTRYPHLRATDDRTDDGDAWAQSFTSVYKPTRVKFAQNPLG